jgi:hypothetical protein
MVSSEAVEEYQNYMCKNGSKSQCSAITLASDLYFAAIHNAISKCKSGSSFYN